LPIARGATSVVPLVSIRCELHAVHQPSSDILYLTAVDNAFGTEIDYAQLHEIYSSESTGPYSPAVCISYKTAEVSGSPDGAQNLTMRMSIRRFTRLTNAFSKKIENHAAMVTLYFTYYNFGRCITRYA
jgi:hypothetical protein